LFIFFYSSIEIQGSKEKKKGGDTICMSQKDKSASHNNKTSPLTCIDDYEFHRSLGKGSMGKVKLGVHVVSGEKVRLPMLA